MACGCRFLSRLVRPAAVTTALQPPLWHLTHTTTLIKGRPCGVRLRGCHAPAGRPPEFPSSPLTAGGGRSRNSFVPGAECWRCENLGAQWSISRMCPLPVTHQSLKGLSPAERAWGPAGQLDHLQHRDSWCECLHLSQPGAVRPHLSAAWGASPQGRGAPEEVRGLSAAAPTDMAQPRVCVGVCV